MFEKMRPKNKDGKLRAIVIGRVSTLSQQQSNIEAGYQYVAPFLKGLHDGEIIAKYLGEQGSGMLVNRATILEACELVDSGEWDVVLMEDLSKCYRNPRYIYAFVQDCVDADTRVISPGDGLDTYSESWEAALSSAVLRHGMHIPDTRRRIRRTANSGFDTGGMVMKVRAGYRKLTKDEAASGTFGPVGLRVAKLPEFTTIFEKIWSMIVVAGSRPSDVVDWLIAEQTPTGPYVEGGIWSVKVLLDLLHDPILYGLRRFRVFKHEYVYKTGKHRRIKNATPDKQICESLAHLTQAQFDELQVALQKNVKCSDMPSGRDSPRYQVPRRKTISPLQHARCAACGGLMYSAGTGEIKCMNTQDRQTKKCWNHVQASAEKARAVMIDILLKLIVSMPAAVQAMHDAAWEQLQTQGKRSGALTATLAKDIEKLVAQSERLTKAIKLGGKLSTLVAELKVVEQQLVDSRKRQAKTTEARPDENMPGLREDFALVPREALLVLARSSFEFGDLMRRIFPRFVIQPVQTLDCGLVRPKALLTLDLSPLLPPGAVAPPPSEYSVDLFTPSVHIQQLSAVVAMKAAKLARGEKASLQILADALGIGRMTVKRALAYDRRMQTESLTEPYRVLKEPPAKASRWKTRPPKRRGLAA